jgi:hypothetical protein
MATTVSAPLADQILSTWRRHNDILLHLLNKVPGSGLSCGRCAASLSSAPSALRIRVPR